MLHTEVDALRRRAHQRIFRRLRGFARHYRSSRTPTSACDAGNQATLIGRQAAVAQLHQDRAPLQPRLLLELLRGLPLWLHLFQRRFRLFGSEGGSDHHPWGLAESRELTYLLRKNNN